MAARSPRYPSNSRAQAAAWTLAVSVTTPSMSKRTASMRSVRMTTFRSGPINLSVAPPVQASEHYRRGEGTSPGSHELVGDPGRVILRRTSLVHRGGRPQCHPTDPLGCWWRGADEGRSHNRRRGESDEGRRRTSRTRDREPEEEARVRGAPTRLRAGERVPRRDLGGHERWDLVLAHLPDPRMGHRTRVPRVGRLRTP